MSELSALAAVSINSSSVFPVRNDAKPVPIDDWTSLQGRQAEIRYRNIPVCAGLVDAVMRDGTILWISPEAGTRRLFEKAEAYEAWAAETAHNMTRTDPTVSISAVATG